jgi:hypothetical protein
MTKFKFKKTRVAVGSISHPRGLAAVAIIDAASGDVICSVTGKHRANCAAFVVENARTRNDVFTKVNQFALG